MWKKVISEYLYMLIIKCLHYFVNDSDRICFLKIWSDVAVSNMRWLGCYTLGAMKENERFLNSVLGLGMNKGFKVEWRVTMNDSFEHVD